MEDIKIYIINIKRDTKRKKYMESLCNKFNLNVEFIEAIYGKEITQESIKKFYSKNKAIQEIGRELALGEIGCALSHIKIYKKIQEDNTLYALIFEDDVKFDQELIELLKLKDKFPKRWDIILLGHHGIDRNIDTIGSFFYSKQLNSKYRIKKPCQLAFGTYGYLISNKGAKKLLNATKQLYKPIDDYTGDFKYSNLYIVSPSIVKINYKFDIKNQNMLQREQLKFKKHLKIKQYKYIELLRKLKLYKYLSFIKKHILIFICKIKPIRRYS